MYVPCRIRGGTCMYPDVYEGVHVCTPSYTRGYMHVRTAGYTCVPTLSTYGEVDPFITCGICLLMNICLYMNRSHNDVYAMLGDYDMTKWLLCTLSS